MKAPHLEPRESFGYLINHLARLLARALRDRIAAHGVVPGQFPVLLSLWREDGLTQAELHQRTDVEQATMANTLQRMERDGLIRRVPDPLDGRRSLVRLAPKARALEPALVQAARGVNEAALARLPAARREQLLGDLRLIMEDLQRPQTEAAAKTAARPKAASRLRRR
jgi:DNA-binding MarR family transcriptional regulator